MKPFSNHPEDIKAAIRKIHGTVVEFERARALPHRSVRDVLRGKAVHRTAKAIAVELGEPVERLFPGRYRASHNGDNSTRQNCSHSLNAGAK